ncbi:MAG: DNA mismatch repair endonuclease MutL, partial [Clostridia bacterium]|nr:DNA mismatch repair endonuclease MutL [Clostridia bacterium]
MSIHLLDRETIEKITAGEVVERPVSVVKELVENSVDSGASGITVEIRGGGIEYIRVTDNGCGIPAEEVKLAFTSHATSKLKDAEELSRVLTMGFRGEALASIAAVAKVSMNTKTREAAFGVNISLESGRITDIKQAGCPDGTTVTVNDLFYNVPVRRVFLKKPAYEQSLVTELMQKLALGNPHIAFRFISNGKTVIQTYGDGDIMHAALAVFGSEYALGLKKVDESEGTFSVKGFIGIGDQASPTRARQCFFLNGRLVNCRMLSQALEEACRGRVTIGKYPSCVLMVTLPTGSIDVNVHPGKLEVRFKDEASFRLTAQTLLVRCFTSDRMISQSLPKLQVGPIRPAVAVSDTSEAEKKNTSIPEKPSPLDYLRTLDVQPKTKKEIDALKETPDTVLPPVLRQESTKEKKPALEPALEQFSADILKDLQAPAYRLIGVYQNTYILLEAYENLVLIDQHAAHERLNYEKYKKALNEGTASQPLLIPLVISVTPREEQLLSDNMDLLSEAGYE